jgi:hypothetical protein
MPRSYQNKEWLIKEYKTKDITQIAKQEGVTDNTIRRWLKKFNIPIKKKSNVLQLSKQMVKSLKSPENIKRMKEREQIRQSFMEQKPKPIQKKQKDPIEEDYDKIAKDFEKTLEIEQKNEKELKELWDKKNNYFKKYVAVSLTTKASNEDWINTVSKWMSENLKFEMWWDLRTEENYKILKGIFNMPNSKFYTSTFSYKRWNKPDKVIDVQKLIKEKTITKKVKKVLMNNIINQDPLTKASLDKNQKVWWYITKSSSLEDDSIGGMHYKINRKELYPIALQIGVKEKGKWKYEYVIIEKQFKPMVYYRTIPKQLLTPKLVENKPADTKVIVSILNKIADKTGMQYKKFV